VSPTPNDIPLLTIVKENRSIVLIFGATDVEREARTNPAEAPAFAPRRRLASASFLGRHQTKRRSPLTLPADAL
jgi:hypothetical protein